MALTNNKNAYSGNINFNPRFVEQSISALGWRNDLDPITEWIDNSISSNGNASTIWIDLKTVNDSKRIYDLVVEDNGDGVLPDNMQEAFGTFGTDTDKINVTYNTGDINFYGVGGSAGLVVGALRSDTKISKVISISEDDTGQRWKSVLIFNFNERKKPCTVSQKVKTSKETGIRIEIKSLHLRKPPTHWDKKLGVIYFPNSIIDDNFKIFIDRTNKKTKSVKFEDPFYRHLPQKTLDEYIDHTRHTIHIPKGNTTTAEIEILECKFNRCFPDGKEITDNNGKPKPNLYQQWDTDSANVRRFLQKKSGLYMRLSGRYIKLGENDFPTPTGKELYKSKWMTDVLNLVRFEINVPQNLQMKMGASVDKNQVTLNPVFCEDIIQLVFDRCQHWIKIAMNRKEPAGKDDKDVATKLENILNKEIKKTLPKGLLSSTLLTSNVIPINKRDYKKRDPNGNGKTPTGNGTNHKVLKKGHYKNSKLSFRTGVRPESWGASGRMHEFEISKEHQTDGTYLYQFDILLNVDHAHYEIVKSLNGPARTNFILDLYSVAKSYKDMIERFEIDDESEQLGYFKDFVGEMWDISSKTRHKILRS